MDPRRHRDRHHSMRTNAALWSLGSEVREEAQTSQQDPPCHPSSPHSLGKQRADSRSARFINAEGKGLVWTICELGASDKRRRHELSNQLRPMQRESNEEECLLARPDHTCSVPSSLQVLLCGGKPTTSRHCTLSRAVPSEFPRRSPPSRPRRVL